MYSFQVAIGMLCRNIHKALLSEKKIIFVKLFFEIIENLCHKTRFNVLEIEVTSAVAFY
jgi:hypothetical protein